MTDSAETEIFCLNVVKPDYALIVSLEASGRFKIIETIYERKETEKQLSRREIEALFF